MQTKITIEINKNENKSKKNIPCETETNRPSYTYECEK